MTLVVDYKKNILVSRDHVVGQEQNEVVRRIKGYVVDWELDGDGRVHLWDGHQVEEVLDLAGRLLRKQERNIVEDWIWITWDEIVSTFSLLWTKSGQSLWAAE